jgi:hypothetical protein
LFHARPRKNDRQKCTKNPRTNRVDLEALSQLRGDLHEATSLLLEVLATPQRGRQQQRDRLRWRQQPSPEAAAGSGEHRCLL